MVKSTWDSLDHWISSCHRLCPAQDLPAQGSRKHSATFVSWWKCCFESPRRRLKKRGSYVAEREELGFAALRAMLFDVTLQAFMDLLWRFDLFLFHLEDSNTSLDLFSTASICHMMSYVCLTSRHTYWTYCSLRGLVVFCSVGDVTRLGCWLWMFTAFAASLFRRQMGRTRPFTLYAAWAAVHQIVSWTSWISSWKASRLVVKPKASRAEATVVSWCWPAARRPVVWDSRSSEGSTLPYVPQGATVQLAVLFFNWRSKCYQTSWSRRWLGGG